MNFDLGQIASISMILFAIIDIVGSIPILLDLQVKMGTIQSEKATIVSGLIMIIFLFVGEQILRVIGIDVSSFAIAGSFIIFFLALEMILGITFYRENTVATASVIPIAFPLIAGTGTLTTLLSLRAEYPIENIIAAILINLIVVYIVLKNTFRLEKVLGAGGINILRKVFGIILLALSVKLFRTHVGV
jgi:multiple antibiotic resistance protein